MALSDEELREAVVAFNASGGNKQKAADALGIKRETLRDRLKVAETRGVAETPMIEMPAFVLDGDEDEPIEDIIDRMAKRFEKAKKAHDARQWFPIKVNENKPIGILFVGDPHLDDNGCNWPVLRDHVNICRNTEGMFAVNIGDSTNCWGGRLIKKYADQETSVHTARRLVEWFLLESGVRWLVWLMGNHEHMGDGAPLLHQMNKRYGSVRVPMLDWQARFSLQFANGSEFRISAAHDFPGNSMWNPNHGPVKAASFGDNVDLVVCGHRHNWAISQWEMAEKGVTPLLVRLRGYKHLDDYARRIGKYEQDEGQSILVVFDPESKSPAGRMKAFVDIGEGADYLTWLRSRP